MTRRPTDDPEPLSEPMRPRSNGLRRHVRARSKQRLGIRVTEAELVEIERHLAARTAHFVHREPRGRSIWDVILRGRLTRVVYDHEREELVTVLPDDCRVRPAKRRPA